MSPSGPAWQILCVDDDADVLAGMGAAGSRAHADGETVDLASIPRQALRSAVLIGRLARTPR